MKICVLSGAYVNAGDFLIVERTKKLLKHFISNVEIIEFKRNLDLSNYLDEINKCDALIIAGGPAYIKNLYPNVIPLVKDLSKIRPKIFTVGLGWYGINTSSRFINDYIFNSKTIKLFKRIENDAKFLTCRDWYSVNTLKNNRFKNVLMTGCPAWYDLENVDNLEIRKNVNYEYKKICISDPASKINIKNCKLLMKYLKENYDKSKIYFVLHRKDEKNNYNELIKYAEENSIIVKDITGSADGFEFYDDCDLHIGFRVHAHIYNLSKRNISVLLEEDGRGAGVNEALGLKSIKTYKPYDYFSYKNDYISKIITIIQRRIFKINARLNKYIINEIDDYLYDLKNSEYYQIKRAYLSMNEYFKNMKFAIESIKGSDTK